MRYAAIVIGVLVLVIVAGMALELLGVEWFRFIGPRKESARREVFEETRSYNESKIQDLARYRLQYLRAKTSDEKKAIASTVRHLFANYDRAKLPPELRSFLSEINRGM